MTAEGRPTNVLLLSSSLWIGGAETVIQHLAERLDRRRFNVSVCDIRERGQIGEALAQAGVDVTGIWDSDKPNYLTFLRLRRLIKTKNIDVVHTHTPEALFAAGLCRLMMPRLKLLHTFHFGNYPNTSRSILWIDRVFSRVATRLVSVGEAQRATLKRVFGFTDGQVETVFNGVPFVQPRGDAELRRRVGATNGTLLVGTIATLIQQKGLTDLLRVAQILRDRGCDVRFVVIGEGHLRAELEARRRELGVDDTVAFTGWITNAAEVALPVFDVFFQPSLWEAMSMVILEAMAAARPIVATRVGENQKILDDGVDGILVNVGDVEAMADALGRLAVDPALRTQLGVMARRKVEQRYTVEHMARHYERIYQEMRQ